MQVMPCQSDLILLHKWGLDDSQSHTTVSQLWPENHFKYPYLFNPLFPFVVTLFMSYPKLVIWLWNIHFKQLLKFSSNFEHQVQFQFDTSKHKLKTSDRLNSFHGVSIRSIQKLWHFCIRISILRKNRNTPRFQLWYDIMLKLSKARPISFTFRLDCFIHFIV